MLKEKIRTTRLRSGESVPVLGQGTWHLGEGQHPREQEISALRLGVDLGMTLIDTAEMYGDGATEELVGEAISGRRDEVFLVSKVLPQNATRRGTVAACDRSLRRLRTDHLDLYLLHWRGEVPLEETMDGLQDLIQQQKIRQWGVSNFDTSDLEELFTVDGGSEVSTDQVLYNLTRRGVEYDLLPWCRARKIPVMTYSPIEQGRMLHNSVLRSIATRHRASPAQVALAWLLGKEGLIAIPKAADQNHVRQNRDALDLNLDTQDLEALDSEFPAPSGPTPLEML